MTVVFRGLTAVCAVAGIVFLLTWSHGDWGVFVYFTVQSSVIIALVSAVAVFRAVPAPVRGAATLYSCITGTVYHALLANPSSPFYQEDSGAHSVHNLLLHTVTPILAAVTWLLVERERVRWWYATVWLAYPLAYLVFALIRGVFVHEYPYPFIDVNTQHAGGVTVNSLGFTVAFFLLGMLLIGLGTLLRRALPGRAAASDQDARVEDPARI
ncbi:Pr6Pr family membrane protein [Dactylosporangium sp. NPDC048998]|uniref:Pr6Pr family membrane protein n=1 Tax=Dactylosporangium sp. NPDC048998 TaxID=3363976 RepID=UPI003724C017